MPRGPRLLHDDVAPFAQGLVVGPAEDELDLGLTPRWPSEGGLIGIDPRARELAETLALICCTMLELLDAPVCPKDRGAR